MDRKEKDLSDLHYFIEGVDKEVTMLLQSLQWDRKHILEGCSLVSCRYDADHKVPPDKIESHEKECYLRREGYSKEDKMLPEPLDPKASTVVKLGKEDIQQIINSAAQADPTFQRGRGCAGSEPLTAERLQAAYTADERRAIHDAVVSCAPDFEHVEDIHLNSAETKQESRRKSRLEVLAELRDMRRRRVKYRSAASAASRNYSNVLRDLIRTQMELYTGASTDLASQSNPSSSHHTTKGTNQNVQVKREPLSDEENRSYQQQSSDRHSKRSDNRDRRNYRQQDDHHHSTDNSDRRHRDRLESYPHKPVERQYKQNRETYTHGKSHDYNRRDEIRVKEEPESDKDDDRRRKHIEKESSRQEQHRHRDNYHETSEFRITKERYSEHTDIRDKYPKDKRYYKEHDIGHSATKPRKEHSEGSSSRDKDGSRKHKYDKDFESRTETRHKKTKLHERSKSKTREREHKSDPYKSREEDKYKRYYDMKRALADEDTKRKKHS